MANVELKNISKNFGDTKIIKNINLSIKSGEFIVFVGPSGCGKSTLLRLISGLESISDGHILIDNEDVSDKEPSKRNISFVFQSYALYPHMNVKENISFGLKLSKNQNVDEKVNEIASMLQIKPLLERLPKELSGGQRQRVAIGRSISREPKVFLFDEPLSNLDAELRVSTRIELAKMHKDLKATMIYVTHDQVEAMTLADKIAVLKKGKLQQFDSPSNVYNDPCNLFTAGFIGSPSMNFIDVAISKEDEKICINLKNIDGQDNLIYLEDNFKDLDKYINKTVVAGLRSEHIQNGFRDISVEQELQLVKSKVNFSELTGPDVFVYITLNDTEVIARVSPSGSKDDGKDITLKVWAKKIIFFDKKTHERIR